jgi:hypothetical protein
MVGSISAWKAWRSGGITSFLLSLQTWSTWWVYDSCMETGQTGPLLLFSLLSSLCSPPYIAWRFMERYRFFYFLWSKHGATQQKRARTQTGPLLLFSLLSSLCSPPLHCVHHTHGTRANWARFIKRARFFYFLYFLHCCNSLKPGLQLNGPASFIFFTFFIWYHLLSFNYINGATDR